MGNGTCEGIEIGNGTLPGKGTKPCGKGTKPAGGAAPGGRFKTFGVDADAIGALGGAVRTTFGGATGGAGGDTYGGAGGGGANDGGFGGGGSTGGVGGGGRLFIAPKKRNLHFLSTGYRFRFLSMNGDDEIDTYFLLLLSSSTAEGGIGSTYFP